MVRDALTCHGLFIKDALMKKMVRYKLDETGHPLRIEKEIYSYMDFEWLETDSNGENTG